MRKPFLFLLLSFVILSPTLAQQSKSYLTISISSGFYDLGYNDTNYQMFYLGGNIPSDMKTIYTPFQLLQIGKVDMTTDIPLLSKKSQALGILLNLLSDNGFMVESIFTKSEDSFTLILLSKTSSSSAPTRIERVTTDEDSDSEIHEVARYNLQGMPVNEKEKGIQIIVYSNYTTKTVINE